MISIYGANIHAKFWQEICKEKQDGACAQTETSRTYALKTYKKETNKDEAATAHFAMAQSKTTGHSNMYNFLSFVACRAICQWEIQCWKCSASGRENSFLQAIGKESCMMGLSMDLLP